MKNGGSGGGTGGRKPYEKPRDYRPRAEATTSNQAPARTPYKDPNAMDVDQVRSDTRVCYNCNKKGHIARYCRERKEFAVRRVVKEMSREDRKAFLKELMEEDFQEDQE